MESREGKRDQTTTPTLLHVLTVDSRVSSNEATKKKLPMRKEDMRDIEVDDNPLSQAKSFARINK